MCDTDDLLAISRSETLRIDLEFVRVSSTIHAPMGGDVLAFINECSPFRRSISLLNAKGRSRNPSRNTWVSSIQLYYKFRISSHPI